MSLVPVPSLTMVGASHHTAPVDLRERLAFPSDKTHQALTRLREQGEALLLSTCNRTEIYVVSDEVRASRRVLAELRGLDSAELNATCYVMADEEAVLHLLRVASGLDSMILGETQILGQVRDAFETAVAAGSVGRVLGRLLPLALEVGKRARTDTAISRRALSPSSVAVELARQHLGDLRPLVALVIGAGDAGRAVARSLKAAGVARILVANRSTERADSLAASVGGEPLPYADLTTGLVEADIIIAATGASDHVLTAPLVSRALEARGGRRLLCVDIAMPRDIDPDVGKLPDVVLCNIDDLEAVCAENLRDREAEITAVEAIVQEGLADYREWKAVEPLVPMIGALYQRAEAIRRAEVDRTMSRLKRISEEDREMIDVMTAAIVRRLLHTPVAALRARGGDPRARELAELAKELFALFPDEGLGSVQ